MSLPRMSWHIGDYLKDTTHLSTIEHGAYFLLSMHYWANDGLPNDDKQLAAIARMTVREWKSARQVLRPLFKLPGEWKHKRIEEEIEEATTKYEKRSAAGKKGGEAKATGKQNLSNATAKPYQPITDNRESEKGIETRERASDLLIEFAKVCSTPADDPAFFGFHHQLNSLISRGFTKETILAGTARAMHGKSQVPVWAYFSKVIESENAERSALAKPEVYRGQATRSNGITAVIDRKLAEISGPERSCDAVRENPPRLLSHGGRE